MSNDFVKPNPEEAAAAFARLTEIVAQLRAPDGCPWDKEQTHLTLRRHLLEETYETLEAIEENDDAHLCEELGDLLMQPVMHAQLAAEENRFDIAQVLNGISDKLVRRHPHVFGDVKAADSDAVLRNWDAIKKQEKAEKSAAQNAREYSHERKTQSSILDGVATTLPSLTLAQEVSKRAAKSGFEWPQENDVLEKLREEIAELQHELKIANPRDAKDNRERISEELGDVLFTAVNVARWRGLDAELALRDGVHRFCERFRAMERLASTRGAALPDLSPAAWDELWNKAKRETQSADSR